MTKQPNSAQKRKLSDLSRRGVGAVAPSKKQVRNWMADILRTCVSFGFWVDGGWWMLSIGFFAQTADSVRKSPALDAFCLSIRVSIHVSSRFLVLLGRCQNPDLRTRLVVGVETLRWRRRALRGPNPLPETNVAPMKHVAPPGRIQRRTLV